MSRAKKKQKTKLVICGISGRMGQEIVKVVHQDPDWQLAGGVDRADATLGVRLEPELSAFQRKDVDVVIDFSSPAIFGDIVDWCVKNKRPLVSGTTGLGRDDFARLKSASRKIPVLWAPNMSLGIAMFTELIKKVAQLDDFDFQIEEFHHRHKKDKPSGTAILLQDVLKASVTKEVPEAISIRGGGIFGIHRLYCMSPDETITIEHVALNRSVFAKGAVSAARWLVGQKAGSYELKDTLKR
ncbi:MAG TPA: 4-hydroxy-tetrahydrodipicolinate reductase [Bdellovibrionales bacterium]|nr:4-hydroxy-tetrahydrodipicolinate reductase [Bdellovibrionales bacterium]